MLMLPCESSPKTDLIRENKKERASLALKWKKAHEELLRRVDGWLINVGQQVTDTIVVFWLLVGGLLSSLEKPFA